MTKEKLEKIKRIIIKILVYASIVLLYINLLLFFIPAFEVYQPTRSKTVLGVTEYLDWITERVSLFNLILPMILSIPYIVSIIKIRKENSPFKKILNNKVDESISFILLRFTNLAIIGVMLYVNFYLKAGISNYVEYGAYSCMTIGGKLIIICNIILIVFLTILFIISKFMVKETQKNNEINNIEKQKEINEQVNNEKEDNNVVIAKMEDNIYEDKNNIS